MTDNLPPPEQPPVPGPAKPVDPATAAAEPTTASEPIPAAEPASAPKPAAGRRRGAESPPYNDWPFRYLQSFSQWLTGWAIMTVRVTGRERVPATGPVILAGNHAGWLDGPLVVIQAPRTVRCLVKAELFRGAPGVLLRTVGQIPVKRGTADRTALHTALDELDRGGAIAVFPEGTRGAGELAEVQHGIAYLAVHGRCPVVPVATFGTGDAMPKGRRWPKRSVPIDIVYGEPFQVEIPANPRSRRALAAVAEEIRVRMATHLADARAAAQGAGTNRGDQ